MKAKVSVIPESVSHYRILQMLGAGGMGEVYLAEDTNLHRKVAIKFLAAASTADERAKKRLIREAQAAATLDHPNICAIYEVSAEDSRSFIVMQYVEGETLASRIRTKPLEFSECLEIATQVADALVEAHAHGIIHRDIKPQNIMLTTRHQAKVMDFGLAEVVRDRSPVDSEAITESLLTEPGALIGTIPYISPEQMRGESQDVRSDIFSFGAVLYEMITGHRAFAAENAAMMITAIVSREPAPLARYTSGVSPELERIVSKALHKDREERYQTSKDLLIDLRSLKHHLEFAEELERSLIPDGAKGGQAATAWIKRHVPGLIIVAATLVLAVTALFYQTYSPSSSKVIDSIAVLPLVNADNNPEIEYLSDGITESLINTLSRVPQLRVVARTTAFRYKGKEIDSRQVGRELGVQAVLTGRLLQRGDQLALQVDLVETDKGSQLWGEQYNRKASDLLAVRQELARDISERLGLRLGGEDEKQLTKGGTDNPEAYELYLRGRHFWNWQMANLKKAIEQFQQAIDKDPNYALAYVGLADCYVVLELYAITPASEALPKARAAVQQALRIDDSLAEAHASLGLIEQSSWNFSEAEREYKRAIELNPNYATAHWWYSVYLRAVRDRLDEAMAEIKRAQQFDPLSPAISINIVAIHIVKGEMDAAIEEAKKVLELDPNFFYAYAELGIAYQKQGRYEEAIVEMEKAVELSARQGWSLAFLGMCYAVAGKMAGARALLKELEEKYHRGEASGQYLAGVYAALGDKEQAFAWLEKDFQARRSLLPFIAYAEEDDILREKLSSDPRWNDLLRRIGLPQN